MTAPTPALDRDAFVAWLRGLPPSTIVGQRAVASGCPLACYLHQYQPNAIVTAYEYWEGVPGEWFWALPLWAVTFVATVDRRGDEPFVTAGEALALLGVGPAAPVVAPERELVGVR